ncbi:MAG: cysteine peptidase family C39 domain-containing protein, partial [Fibrobacteria bacterium]
MKLDLHVSKQPDDESCGITCLQAIYAYHDYPASLDKLKREIEHWQTGGTVAVNLARNALAHGFRAEIYTYNIK